MADLRGTHKKFVQEYIDTFKAVNTTVTGATATSVWTPASAKKFVLMGWSLSWVVTTTFNGANAPVLVFCDNALATAVGPALTAFATTAAANTNAGYSNFHYRAGGWESATANNVLKIAFTVNASAGTIAISGHVFGRETS